jgi:hypothetical protein
MAAAFVIGMGSTDSHWWVLVRILLGITAAVIV